MKAGAKISSFLWWTYPRGSLEYDLMVGIILGFIFLTPRHVFRDQPRPASTAVSRNPAGSPAALSAPPRHLAPPAAVAR